jgi:hypothetical protein
MMRRRNAAILLAGASLAVLIWSAMAYLRPELRKAIMYSGLGIC